MTKKLFSLLIALPTCLNAQNFFIKGGYVAPTISYEEVGSFNNKWKSSFNLGAGVEFKLKERFSLLSEISFVQKGSSFTYRFENANLNIFYLDFDVLFKYSFGTRNQVFFLTGPYLGIGLFGDCYMYNGRDHVKIKFYPSYVPSSTDVEFIGWIDHRIEGGAQIGVGYLLTKNFNAEIRYAHGLTKLYGQPHNNSWESGYDMVDHAKNRMLQVNLIWYFKKREK